MTHFPTIDLSKTGQNITALRKAKGLSVKELKEILGLQTCYAIYKWQNGECLPTIDNLLVLATIFQVKIDDILVTN